MSEHWIGPMTVLIAVVLFLGALELGFYWDDIKVYFKKLKNRKRLNSSRGYELHTKMIKDCPHYAIWSIEDEEYIAIDLEGYSTLFKWTKWTNDLDFALKNLEGKREEYLEKIKQQKIKIMDI